MPKYKTLDISLLSVAPEMRCTAAGIQSQMAPPGLVDYLRHVVSRGKELAKALKGRSAA